MVSMRCLPVSVSRVVLLYSWRGHWSHGGKKHRHINNLPAPAPTHTQTWTWGFSLTSSKLTHQMLLCILHIAHTVTSVTKLHSKQIRNKMMPEKWPLPQRVYETERGKRSHPKFVGWDTKEGGRAFTTTHIKYNKLEALAVRKGCLNSNILKQHYSIWPDFMSWRQTICPEMFCSASWWNSSHPFSQWFPFAFDGWFVYELVF